jgi:pimeloyl-ACP methyl ester carboxylesterase
MGCTIGTLCKCLVFPAPSESNPDIAAEWEAFRQEHGDEVAWLTTKGGDEVPALYIRPPAGAPTLTVLYSHGNAEDITLIHPRLEALARQHNVAFFLYEYSGYSLATGGGPSESAFYQDIEAAFAHLTETLNVPRGQIVLWGRSIGSGPTVHLAAKEPGLAGMMLESGLASACRFQGCAGGVCSMLCCCGLFDFFNNQRKLRRVDCPTFIMHGKADVVVRPSNSALNHSRLQQPYDPYYQDGAGHNDLDTYDRDEYDRQVKLFFTRMRDESNKRQWGALGGSTDLAASMQARMA